ncbi:MAG: rRNA maturation RNase YbeY [Nitrospinota bacterium]|nr:rRNA maturation RNase YbeY [Nitrospinota bacterium]
MRIQIQKRRTGQTPSAAALRARLEKMLAAAEEPDAELSITFIADKEMATLNGQYRGKNHPTDVLAFPQREGEFSEVAPSMLGDVVISVDTAARQAREAGHSLEREMDVLLAHGLAHLLGYDHEKGPAQARAMKRMEKKLLAAI